MTFFFLSYKNLTIFAPKLNSCPKRLHDKTHVSTSKTELDYWPELDEDLSFEGFFKKSDRNKLYSLFMEHPELNASAIARRMGISQSLFAQYIGGQKTPSAEREEAILNEIRQIGQELSRVS